MNEQERKLLSKQALSTDPPMTFAGTLKWLAVWSGGFVLCCLAALAIFLVDMPIPAGIFCGPVAIAVIICLCATIVLIGSYFRWSRYHRDFVQRVIPEIKAALADGRVFVKKVSTDAVIELIEFEDEGSGYIYDVGDGRILFLKGQRFFPVDDGNPWPNSEFEIVRTVHCDLWIGIFCSGESLTPTRELETSECIDDIVWADREDILDGNIEQFAKSITKAE